MRIVKPKLNLLEKLRLKYFNRAQYIDYKYYRQFADVPNVNLAVSDKTDYHFKHSGNAGDIIYAMPTMLALAKANNIHLHLHINQYSNYENQYHPLGNVMLNEKMVALLRPLILSNRQIKTCEVYTNQQIDYDLDAFRSYPIMLDRGNIARWYFLLFATNYDLNQSWLDVAGDSTYQNAIVVARSHRYLAPGISYSFLQQYPEVYFIGIGKEYEDMKAMVPSIKYVPVNDFRHMAEVIKGSRLFIGNQSFPFSIAEALKTNRLLELYFKAPNVTVYGDKGFEFCYQPQFEKLVKERYRAGY